LRADKQHYLKKERLRAAFQAIDLDGSGTIDAAELKHLVGAEQDLTQVLAEIGKGVDDVITLEEFEAILVKKSVMSNLRRPRLAQGLNEKLVVA
jgi:Ca2+-binding EF-hand superfamily protein